MSQNRTKFSGNRIVRWFPLIIVGLGVSVAPLDTSVNIAFPDISNSFEIPIAGIQWVIISYVLTNATLQLGFGRLGDMIGYKKVVVVGLVLSGISFFFCGYASDFKLFLLARCMQGLGAALVLSCAPALATLNYPEKERGKVLGGFFLFFSVALAGGPMIGGQLVAQWGWPSVFFFRIPIALLAALLTLFFLKQPGIENKNQSFDWQGWLSLIFFIGALLFALSQGNHWGWFSIRFVVLISFGFCCFLFFVWHELRTKEPIIDLRFFGNLGFSLSNLAFVFIIAPSFFIFLLIPYYLVTYLKVSTSTGGLLLAMAPVGTMISSALGGPLLVRFSVQKLRILGIVVATVSLLGISYLQTDPRLLLIILLLLINGFGIGLFQVAHMDYVMAFIPLHQRGVAGSLTLTTQTIGIFSGATLGTFIFDYFKSDYTSLLKSTTKIASDLELQIFISAFQDTFLMGTLLSFIALMLLWSGAHKKFQRRSS